jgi:hypothetical protein
MLLKTLDVIHNPWESPFAKKSNRNGPLMLACFDDRPTIQDWQAGFTKSLTGITLSLVFDTF